MSERGLFLDHTTIYRWVQRYVPEIDKHCRPYLKQTNDSCKKGQMAGAAKRDVQVQNQFIAGLFGIAV